MRVLLTLLCVTALTAATGVAAPADPPPTQPAQPSDERVESALPETGATEVPIPEHAVQMEVTALRVQGKRPWHRLAIEDLDVAVTPRKERLLPLLRILNALRIEFAEEDGQISFQPEGLLPVVLDIERKQLKLGNTWAPVAVVPAMSIITQSRDLYVPAKVICDIFSMTLEWNEAEYKYIGSTEHPYKIWKTDREMSLLGIVTREVPTDLPELFSPAYPRDWSLDFFEFRLRTQSNLVRPDIEEQPFQLDAVEQSFWGSMGEGRFYLNFAEPSILWNRKGLSNSDESALMLRWGDLTFESPDSELVFGDSNFALGSLVFPFLRFTGVRFNGLTGMTEEMAFWDASRRGYRRRFLRPRIFMGFARVGSMAELFINDRLIDTDEVLTDFPGAPPDEGIWRFRNVTLPPGTTNEVRIVITDPDGFRTQIERTIFSTSILVPEGDVAYMMGAGTNRDTVTWRTRGVAGGARVLYGLTDRLTLGGMMAFQDSFNDPLVMDPLDAAARQVPHKSGHVGGEVAWHAADPLMLSGEFGASMTTEPWDEHSFANTAFTLKGDLAPSRTVNLRSQLFRYGPDFFNGTNTDPNDRQGLSFGGRWRPHQQWTFGSSLGWVGDNVDRDAADTTRLNYQTARVRSSVIPRTSVALEADRIDVNTDRNDLYLYTCQARAALMPGLALDGTIALGDALSPEADPDFLTGLNVPDIPLYQSPYKSVVLRKSFAAGHSLAAAYKESDTVERVSLTHNFRLLKGPRLRLFTDVGYDMDESEPFFENRLEYFFTRAGTTRLSLQTRMERDEWSVMVVFTVTELFGLLEGRPRRITGMTVSPWTGGIQGRVFEDFDGDGLMDPGEGGIEGIRVSSALTSTTTDERGRFLLPSDHRLRQERIFLDPDTVPATHTPTHGIQTAHVSPRTLTHLDLGVCPAHYVIGYVYAFEDGWTEKAVPGIRVFLVRQKDKVHVADSFTAGDGSFYLGNLLPGAYTLRVDPASVPSRYVMPYDSKELVIEPTRQMQEITPSPFFVVRPRPVRDKSE